MMIIQFIVHRIAIVGSTHHVTDDELCPVYMLEEDSTDYCEVVLDTSNDYSAYINDYTCDDGMETNEKSGFDGEEGDEALNTDQHGPSQGNISICDVDGSYKESNEICNSNKSEKNSTRCENKYKTHFVSVNKAITVCNSSLIHASNDQTMPFTNESLKISDAFSSAIDSDTHISDNDTPEDANKVLINDFSVKCSNLERIIEHIKLKNEHKDGNTGSGSMVGIGLKQFVDDFGCEVAMKYGDIVFHQDIPFCQSENEEDEGTSTQNQQISALDQNIPFCQPKNEEDESTSTQQQQVSALISALLFFDRISNIKTKPYLLNCEYIRSHAFKYIKLCEMMDHKFHCVEECFTLVRDIKEYLLFLTKALQLIYMQFQDVRYASYRQDFTVILAARDCMMQKATVFCESLDDMFSLLNWVSNDMYKRWPKGTRTRASQLSVEFNDVMVVKTLFMSAMMAAVYSIDKSSRTTAYFPNGDEMKKVNSSVENLDFDSNTALDLSTHRRGKSLECAPADDTGTRTYEEPFECNPADEETRAYEELSHTDNKQMSTSSIISLQNYDFDNTVNRINISLLMMSNCVKVFNRLISEFQYCHECFKRLKNYIHLRRESQHQFLKRKKLNSRN